MIFPQPLPIDINETDDNNDKHDARNDSERRQYAEVIERQALYMKELIDDFNLTMRLQHGDFPLEAVAVHVTVAHDVITIQDDGIGIDTSELPYMFERYYRGTNTTDALGSGLGMAISRDIIKAHGGTVSVTSARGSGTTIRIELPV